MNVIENVPTGLSWGKTPFRKPVHHGRPRKYDLSHLEKVSMVGVVGINAYQPTKGKVKNWNNFLGSVYSSTRHYSKKTNRSFMFAADTEGAKVYIKRVK